MAIKQSIGIDFGTTNSSLVRCITTEGGITKTVRMGDAEGRPMPSIVAIDRETGEVHTGRDAWNRRSELSERCECIHSVKSLLEDAGWKKHLGGKEWYPKDVAAEVFKALRAPLGIDDSQKISATVAVPIGFSRSKREKVREAAALANIEIEGFVSEPTAAFFANYDELKSCETVVIFDWGGGTLDVSVIRNYGDKISELATCGMDEAGDDIDYKLARKIHERVARKKGKNIAFDEMDASDRDMLIVRAERAKRALGEEDDVVVSLNKYGELGTFRETVNYEWFDAIVEGIVDRAFDCLRTAMVEAGVSRDEVDRIVMVGGTSNIVPLLERLDKEFGDKLLFPEGTVWNISTGAAKLSKTPGKYHAAQDVGIVLSDGSYFPLLTTGADVYRWETTAVFGVTDDSKEMRVVFSGSKDIDASAERNRVVKFPAFNFLEERVMLRAWIDKDMVFNVSVRSDMRSKRDTGFWEYDKLKLYYSLEECGLR